MVDHLESIVDQALGGRPGHWTFAVAGPSGPATIVGDPSRSYRLASVTKPLAAAATWLAIEEGTVSLDDPAGPEGSTLGHLLAHASGLPFEGRDAIAAPGTRRIYSNTGFEVAAEHLAAASGLSMATYLHEGVCAPLDMASTHLDASPAWGATSTVADLIRFGQELLAPTVFDPTTIDRVTSVAFAGLDGVLPGYGRQTPNPWGLGVEVRGNKSPHWTGPDNSAATFGHFGQTGTFLWVDPEARRTAVFLGDRDFGQWAIDAWPRINDAALDAALER
ncbi:MAG: beta-lactamase family protein [Candidatus Microthrix sp.]|jgi:CubicO group peptidase (beta-lactamase class C family)|nr:serine hydrolase domain-containing protein [Candidatus Microthrix sp.]MBK6439840.1 beta-lactamase family protein [Candidatus Microthrix sp.]MBP7596709.1 beta-lactamase family protein [Candidatus Microthrix sp.]